MGGGEALSTFRPPPAAYGKEKDGHSAPTILNYYITNIFHYCHINVILISDLHQADNVSTLAPSQLATWQIFSQLHYFY